MIFCGEIETFLPSFPVLEEIRMANMEWKDRDVTMSSASLRKLSIHATGFEEFENPKSVSFDTPNLLSLNYFALVAEDYPLVNMNKVEEAQINFILKDDQIERVRAPNNDLLEEGEDDVVLRFGNVVKLMNGIQNVERLSLLALSRCFLYVVKRCRCSTTSKRYLLRVKRVEDGKQCQLF